ncbi:MAG: hypothetical protein K5694_01160 [Bacilli bacterium]|nr:hypothetical protein [Bacilli bacterium]
MVKAFLKYQIKQWLPAALIFLSAILGFSIIAATQFNVYDTYYSNPYGTYMSSHADFMTLFFVIPSLILAFVFPFFVYSHRFSRKKNDIIAQLPYNRSVFRNYKLVTGLVVLLLIFSLGYLFGASIAAARFYAAELGGNVIREEWTRVPVSLNGGYIALAYGFGLVLIAADYFINCFIISKVNTILDGIILMAAVWFLLFINIKPFYNMFTNVAYPFIDSQTIRKVTMIIEAIDFSMYRSVATFTEIDKVILGRAETIAILDISSENPASIIRLISLISHISLGICAGILVFVKEEISGEFAGKNGGRHISTNIVLAVGIMATSMMLIQVGYQIAIASILLLILLSTHFFVTVIYNRGFKLKLADWIIFGSCGGLELIYLITIFIAALH